MTPVTVTTPNGSSSTAYKIDRPAAPFLKWERNDQFNVGVDFGILNGRVRLTADWYSKLSKDILLEVARPSHMDILPSLITQVKSRTQVLSLQSVQILSVIKNSAGTQT